MLASLTVAFSLLVVAAADSCSICQSIASAVEKGGCAEAGNLCQALSTPLNLACAYIVKNYCSDIERWVAGGLNSTQICDNLGYCVYDTPTVLFPCVYTSADAYWKFEWSQEITCVNISAGAVTIAVQADTQSDDDWDGRLSGIMGVDMACCGKGKKDCSCQLATNATGFPTPASVVFAATSHNWIERAQLTVSLWVVPLSEDYLEALPARDP